MIKTFFHKTFIINKIQLNYCKGFFLFPAIYAQKRTILIFEFYIYFQNLSKNKPSKVAAYRGFIFYYFTTIN